MDSDATEQDPQINADDDEDGLEPWTDWIKRTTREAEQQFEKLGLDDWVSHQRRRKWRWASHVARGCKDKWTYRALVWNPALDPDCKAQRRHGRPLTRWTDDLMQFMQQLTTTTDNNNNNLDKDNDNDNTTTNNNNDDGCDLTNCDESASDDETSWMTPALDQIRWQELEEQFVHRAEESNHRATAKSTDPY